MLEGLMARSRTHGHGDADGPITNSKNDIDDYVHITCTEPMASRSRSSSKRDEGNSENDGDKEITKQSFLKTLRRLFVDADDKVISGKTILDVPCKKIREIIEQNVFAYNSPQNALECIHKRKFNRRVSEKGFNVDMPPIAGITKWKNRDDSAFIMLTSLYDKVKNGTGNVGDPIADSAAIITRPNNAILVLADGVSWGEKSKLAAWSAVYGCITYLAEHISNAQNTRDIFRSLLKSFEVAHNSIQEEEGTMTTLVAGVVVELYERDKWGFCVVNVGDSLAFVYNPQTGVREVTAGSHEIDSDRDMRYSGGALGPADGYNPDLNNLTCSYTAVQTRDLVFLTSDGVSDNFDPKVGKFYVDLVQSPTSKQVMRKSKSSESIITSDGSEEFIPPYISRHRKSMVPRLVNYRTIDENDTTNLPLESPNDLTTFLENVTPRERHDGMLEKMRQLIEDEPGPGVSGTAIDVCTKFLNFVLKNTQDKRDVFEQNGLDDEESSKLTGKERKEKETLLRQKLKNVKGKLDHATIVAFQAGHSAHKPLTRVRKGSEGYTLISSPDHSPGTTPQGSPSSGHSPPKVNLSTGSPHKMLIPQSIHEHSPRSRKRLEKDSGSPNVLEILVETSI